MRQCVKISEKTATGQLKEHGLMTGNHVFDNLKQCYALAVVPM